jgi:hypothetical protein
MKTLLRELVVGYVARNNFETPEMKKMKQGPPRDAFSFFFVLEWI